MELALSIWQVMDGLSGARICLEGLSSVEMKFLRASALEERLCNIILIVEQCQLYILVF